MAHQKKILVVDDEIDMQQMVALRLESAGYAVVVAANGQEGLFMAEKESPDLIISDVLMPIMDGFAFYKELKKRESLASTPVLILTARGQMEDSFKVVGVDDFIAKPFDAPDLLKKVSRLLGAAHAGEISATSKKVLLAGADAVVIESMSALLTKEGHQTAYAKSGPEIITKAVQMSPDIIIMNVQMNEMPAHEIIKVLRHMSQSEESPILVYSYFAAEELGSMSVRERILNIDAAKKACMDAGATQYLERFNDRVFMDLLKKYLVKKSIPKKQE